LPENGQRHHINSNGKQAGKQIHIQLQAQRPTINNQNKKHRYEPLQRISILISKLSCSLTNHPVAIKNLK
jgi:hypothetical protein